MNDIPRVLHICTSRPSRGQVSGQLCVLARKAVQGYVSMHGTARHYTPKGGTPWVLIHSEMRGYGCACLNSALKVSPHRTLPGSPRNRLQNPAEARIERET
jgi:hypothetical protein